MSSGKSKSTKHLFGTRKVRAENGKRLAPKSLRLKDKVYITECTEEELIGADVAMKKIEE
jgi:hypothetical protein